jgi:hypothetical protein
MIILARVVWILLSVVAIGAPVSAADRQRPLTPGQQRTIEMGGDGSGNALRPPAVVDEKTRRAFTGEYSAAGPVKRAVFEKYLDTLGADGMLDFLEAKYPRCHSESHELGRVIFARLKALGPALDTCKTRCTSGCMHGILMEAFAAQGSQGQHVSITEVQKKMVLLCSEKGKMAKRHKPGNCAHGMGHAVMLAAGYGLEPSLSACGSFKNPAMEYYCATGVFMEYFEGGGSKSAEQGAVLAPCDTLTRFPAACYRYAARRMLVSFKGDLAAVAAECQRLPPRQRLGCFHGLGNAATPTIAERPSLLGLLCGRGGPDEQVMCIEGAIERLADNSETKALAACGTLGGRNGDVCRAAAKEKMYRLNKASMELYYGQ